ncbi:MAG: VOC family protein [Rhizobiaceae bacterium]
MPRAQSFYWYELMTSDTAGAEAFYKAVVGWNTEPFEIPDMGYTVVKAGDRGIGGIMELPEGAKQSGMPPAWVGYIYSADFDATSAAVADAGGHIHRPPSDIPDVGRFSVLSDPQGATFMLLHPIGQDTPPLARNAPGNVGWHELHAVDWASAFDFYGKQFGWEKAEAMDMGGMGVYQLFNVNGELNGAMFNKPAEMPAPAWLFYFNVDSIDDAAKRVVDNGGKIMLQPMEVPDGWVLQGTDPQGAWFALSAPKR